MRIIKNIALLFTLLFHFACSSNETDIEIPIPEQTNGVMALGVDPTDWGGLSEDKMQTVRFFVFNNASGTPELEHNELFDITSGGGTGEVTKFDIVFEVSRRTSGVDDKAVIAIVNEPAGMKNELDGISSFHELHLLELSFADFLNADHLVAGTELLPMTGAVWTDKVYATEAGAKADPAKLILERAVARVDVYIRKDEELTIDVDLGEGSEIILKNTYTKEYFVRNKDAVSNNIFGQLQTVQPADLIDKIWTQSASGNKNIPTASDEDDQGRLICSFYTPERTCTAANHADKLIVQINLVSANANPRSGELVIDRLLHKDNGVEEDMDAVLRNNVYEIIATVQQKDIIPLSVKVMEWDWRNLDVVFK